MFDAFFGLGNRAAFDGENDIAWAALADLDDAFPVDDTFTAGAAYGGSGDFTAFGVGLADGDVLGVEVDEAVEDMFEPGVGVVAAEVAVTGIEVDSDGGVFYQVIDAVESIGEFAVLLVGFDADEDVSGVGAVCSFLERIAHEDVVFCLGGPGGFGAFVRIDNWGATFGGEADSLFEVFDADFRFAEWGVGGESGEFDIGLFAGATDAQRVIEHGDTVEVAGFTEQFTSPVDHGFHVVVAEFGRFLDAPFEGFIVVADELHIDTERDFYHKSKVG